MAQEIKYPRLSDKLYAALERKKREAKKYSIYRLAKDVNRDYGHINRVMHGQSAPSREVLASICSALGCSKQEQREIFHELDYLAPGEKEDEEIRQPACA
jgi:transcriptional regulator with XRE-family HTH domain